MKESFPLEKLYSLFLIKLLLLLSHFSRVQLCATPQTAAHQAPPSLGFSRQEHWSWLPFPSLIKLGLLNCIISSINLYQIEVKLPIPHIQGALSTLSYGTFISNVNHKCMMPIQVINSKISLLTFFPVCGCMQTGFGELGDVYIYFY